MKIQIAPEMKFPTSIVIDLDSITIDGIRLPLAVIPQLLYQLAHPDPRKWYRWERMNGTLQVHVRISEDHDGSIISANAGYAERAEHGSKNSGGQG